MGQNLQMVVTLIGAGVSMLTGVSIIIMLVRSDRKQSRAEGRRDELIGQHTAQFQAVSLRMDNHAARIGNLERTRYMTHDEHQEESDRCQAEIAKRIGETHANLAKIGETIARSEERRQAYRDEDNKRWTHIESILAVVSSKLGLNGAGP